MSADLTHLRATLTEHGSLDKSTVLALLSRLEQAEARVKLLESGIVADLVITSVHSASAIGATVSYISEELLKLGYDGLTERLKQAEQAVQRVRDTCESDSYDMHKDYGNGELVVPVDSIMNALDGDQSRESF